MNSTALIKTYNALPFCEKEILRYAGCKQADMETIELLNTCIGLVADKLSYKVCYREMPLRISEDVCDFGVFSAKSKALAKNLSGCEGAVIFGATIGVEIDRLIAKYSHISPSKALMLQAIGAQSIEALCDTFCRDVKKQYEKPVKPRFSPGYGDLSLQHQRDVFAVLECEKTIGLTLNSSLLMSPSKSVTAILGIGGNDEDEALHNRCGACKNKDCTFRGAL